MNHDYAHCKDFCADCPMTCFRAELEVDLRKRWKNFVGVPLTYSHLYGTEVCKRKKNILQHPHVSKEFSDLWKEKK